MEYTCYDSGNRGFGRSWIPNKLHVKCNGEDSHASGGHAMLSTIMDEVASGNKVSILGFGSFEKKYREARTGRNPRTGEATGIPANDVPAFKAGKGFKDKVNPPVHPKKTAKKTAKKKQTKGKKK